MSDNTIRPAPFEPDLADHCQRLRQTANLLVRATERAVHLECLDKTLGVGLSADEMEVAARNVINLITFLEARLYPPRADDGGPPF